MVLTVEAPARHYGQASGEDQPRLGGRQDAGGSPEPGGDGGIDRVRTPSAWTSTESASGTSALVKTKPLSPRRCEVIQPETASVHHRRLSLKPTA